MFLGCLGCNQVTLALLLAAAADVATTAYALGLPNTYEGNPLAAALLAHYGIAGLAVVKLAALCMLVILRRLCNRAARYAPWIRYAPLAIAVFGTALWGGAAINNALVIWRLT